MVPVSDSGSVSVELLRIGRKTCETIIANMVSSAFVTDFQASLSRLSLISTSGVTAATRSASDRDRLRSSSLCNHISHSE